MKISLLLKQHCNHYEDQIIISLKVCVPISLDSRIKSEILISTDSSHYPHCLRRRKKKSGQYDVVF